MTVEELRDVVSQLITNQRVNDLRREATHLLSGVLGLTPSAVVLHGECAVAPADVARVLEAARRRAAGVPLAYAAGTAAFRHVDLLVDPRVLIPRPETEGLVDRVLGWQVGRGAGGVVVDVGTGSGCIALSLAMEGRFDRVIGTDRSRDALEVARANQARVGAVVEWREGDLLAPVADAGPIAVVANPPYVSEAEWAALEPGVRDHEPRVALVSDDDGMAIIARLVCEAWSLLPIGGLLAVEVDSTRAVRARDAACAAGFCGASIEADLFGRPRYLLAIKE